MRSIGAWTLAGLLAGVTHTATPADAAAPELAIRGRITIAGHPFDGVGRFRFELVDPADRTVWSSGSTATIEAGVTQGVYTVRLGAFDGAAPLRSSWLAAPMRVRAWFDDGTHGLHALDAYSLPARDGAPAAAPGADGPVLAELRALRTEVAALRKDVAGLRHPHTGTPAPAEGATVTIPWRNRPTLGNTNAAVVLVEFTDYQCPFCKRFHDQTFTALRTAFVDTGRIAYVSRNLPLAMHAQAGPAAQAALCAGEQGAYWNLRADLFAHMQQATPEAIRSLAEARGLDLAAYDSCLAAQRHAAELAEDQQDATAVGITGTPSFLLGRREGGVVRGEKIVGAKPLAFFETRIRALLDGPGPEAPR